MKLPKILLALALPSLLAFGCSSGDPTFEDENVAEASQAIGEASCGTLSNPHATFSGSIPYDAPGSVSPDTYTRAGCYRAYVVRLNNVGDDRYDIVVADATLANAAWLPPKPPSTTPPVIHLPTDPTLVPPALSKAACEGRFLRAILYEDGVEKKVRQARGVYTPANFPFAARCALPSVAFGGKNVRNDDLDFWWPGKSYTIAATHRVQDSSSAATLPLRILTAPAPCGHPNQACCNTSFSCDYDSECKASKCAPCGHVGQPVCHSSTTGQEVCYDRPSVASGGKCQACGGEGQLCCRQQDLGYQCSNGSLRCGGDGRCNYPTPPPPPPPPFDCNSCGQGENSTCCPQTCGAYCKKSWHACMPGNYCFSPGVPPACSVSSTAILGQCYDTSGNLYQGLQTGTTASGCGENRDVARLRAGASLATSACLTTRDEHKIGCCLYDFVN